MNQKTAKLLNRYCTVRRLHQPDVKVRYLALPAPARAQARQSMIEVIIVKHGMSAKNLPPWMRKAGAQYMPKEAKSSEAGSSSGPAADASS